MPAHNKYTNAAIHNILLHKVIWHKYISLADDELTMHWKTLSDAFCVMRNI